MSALGSTWRRCQTPPARPCRGSPPSHNIQTTTLAGCAGSAHAAGHQAMQGHNKDSEEADRYQHQGGIELRRELADLLADARRRERAALSQQVHLPSRSMSTHGLMFGSRRQLHSVGFDHQTAQDSWAETGPRPSWISQRPRVTICWQTFLWAPAKAYLIALLAALQ